MPNNAFETEEEQFRYLTVKVGYCNFLREAGNQIQTFIENNNFLAAVNTMMEVRELTAESMKNVMATFLTPSETSEVIGSMVDDQIRSAKRAAAEQNMDVTELSPVGFAIPKTPENEEKIKAIMREMMDRLKELEDQDEPPDFPPFEMGPGSN